MSEEGKPMTCRGKDRGRGNTGRPEGETGEGGVEEGEVPVLLESSS